MELELSPLDRRYEPLRTSRRKRDSGVVASLDGDGQQLPIVVAGANDGRDVPVGGAKCGRTLFKLVVAE